MSIDVSWVTSEQDELMFIKADAWNATPFTLSSKLRVINYLKSLNSLADVVSDENESLRTDSFDHSKADKSWITIPEEDHLFDTALQLKATKFTLSSKNRVIIFLRERDLYSQRKKTTTSLKKDLRNTSTERIICLSHKMIGQLIGKDGANIKLIRRACNIDVLVVASQDMLSLNDNDKIEVILRCQSNEKTFEDKEWSENVYRYINSATKGGFVKKLTKAEYDDLAREKDGSILDENALKILEDRLCVEIVYINFDDLVYVCVLERMGARSLPSTETSGKLKDAIKIIGGFVHTRYRQDRPAVETNSITHKEVKRRDAKNRR